MANQPVKCRAFQFFDKSQTLSFRLKNTLLHFHSLHLVLCPCLCYKLFQ
jgi:hypothetical protein